MTKFYKIASTLFILILSLGIKAQTLNLTGTPTSPTCVNGNNGSINVAVAGCPGPYTITSVPALTFNNGVANNVSPGTYQISATSPASGGVQTLYSTNFSSSAGWQLNVVTGAEGGSPNPWFIGSGAGASPANCGTSSNTALFIKCTGFICDLFGGGGPVFNASSTANNTDRSAHLTTDINTTGLSNITLKFAWRSGGSAQSYGNVRYSTDGGSTWTDLPQIYNNSSSWTCANVSLPAQTENISNLRIGFRWRNNPTGSDPPFTITNVIVEGSGSGGSACSGSTSVIVANPPPATFALTASGPLSLCSGQSVTLSVPAGITNPIWSTGATTNSITVSQAGNYSATGTNAQSCASTSNVLVVNVDNNVGVMNVTANGSLSICPGQSVTLTAEAGTTDLLWSNNATSNSIIITQAGTYSAIGKNSIGCNVASEEFVVTIDNSVGVLAVTADGALALCEGQSVTLTADANANNIVWSNLETTQSITVSTAGDYSATAENENGCALASETFTVTVGVTEPGGISVTPAGPVQVCEGVPVTLTAESGFTNYVWSNEAEGESITVTSAGEYSVTALNSEGCQASSLPVEVIEVEVPVASFDYEQDFSGFTVQFTNTSVDGFQYSWTFSPGNTSTQANPSFTYPFDGIYPVRLIVSNSCGSDTITININVIKTSINDLNPAFSSIKVSPNPTHGLSIISGEVKSKETYSLIIYNSIGQRIISEQLNVNGVWNKNIDLHAYPKGMYWISIENKHGKITKKLVKI